MTTMKSLLLGTAAGLVAIAGAQAADMPVKAKAVQYVKICSLYGAGFYYIPGTDTCLKVGGFVRADYYVNSVQSSGFVQLGTYNRATNYLTSRARAAITLDARSQTAYGTLRSYAQFGINSTDSGQNATSYIQYAYIQFAGFTFGNATSFFDIYGADQTHLNERVWTNGSTNSFGINLLAYTAQFGNGVSASLSLEDPLIRRAAVFSVNGAGVVTAASKGVNYPDLVANLRVDQSWGYAQISGAIHDASATWYGNTFPGGVGAPDATGYAIAAGGLFKIPGTNGDTFGIQASYSHGATGYVTNLNSSYGTFGAVTSIVRDSTLTRVMVSDAVFSSTVGSSTNLTNAWGVEAGYEHVWMPGLKTSLAGGYVSIDYNTTASALLCGGLAGCNADVSWYNIGSRTTWTPVQNLDIGIDVVYTHFNAPGVPAGAAPGVNASSMLGAQAGASAFGNADIWSGMLRVQRNFWK